MFKVLLSKSADKDLKKLSKKAISSDQKKKDLANLVLLMKKYADDGEIINTEKVKYEDDGFWAFKAYQTRAYFWISRKHSNSIIISNLSEKKKNRLCKEDREKMKRVRTSVED
ncbi:MAG: hypothetical protein JAY94_14745 [Candidatus Thiodiazotropha endolucinida]|nr:hypothetical protein [Candidatus Thiodiazotropha taylori]MCW4318769.1 hypothetical protein [Candidatus Thiodiazotropha taylori]